MQNQFDYFSDIEEEFVRLRGAHLYLSPTEWALIETWKTAGIPLRVVLQGIDKAFKSHASSTNARERSTR